MTKIVPVTKSETCQTQVPGEWRDTLCEIVSAFKDGDFSLSRGVKRVKTISTRDAEYIFNNLNSYRNQITDLPESSWKTSVCQWMCGYWDALIDLYTVEEGASDLVMFVRVYEDGADFTFEVISVHVP